MIRVVLSLIMIAKSS